MVEADPLLPLAICMLVGLVMSSGSILAALIIDVKRRALKTDDEVAQEILEVLKDTVYDEAQLAQSRRPSDPTRDSDARASSAEPPVSARSRRPSLGSAAAFVGQALPGLSTESLRDEKEPHELEILFEDLGLARKEARPLVDAGLNAEDLAYLADSELDRLLADTRVKIKITRLIKERF